MHMWNLQIGWRGPNLEATELAVQLEDLLHQVWKSERWWRVDDRLDLAARLARATETGHAPRTG